MFKFIKPGESGGQPESEPLYKSRLTAEQWRWINGAKDKVSMLSFKGRKVLLERIASGIIDPTDAILELRKYANSLVIG